MKFTVKRILVLLLAFAMVLSLAACSGSKDDGGSSSGKETGSGDSETGGKETEPTAVPVKDDPAGYLAAALKNTGDELNDRYAGSPLAAIAGALDTAGTVSLSGEIESYDGVVDINDFSLAYDTDAKSFLLNLDMSEDGFDLTGGVCLSPDFLGVSFPLFTGSDDYYGIKPRNIGSQLKASFLWEYIREDVSTSDLDQLDDMLDLLWDSQLIDIDELTKDIQDLGTDFIKGLDLDYEQDTVKLDGKSTDGYVFAAVVDSDDLASVMEKVYGMILDMPMWETLVELGRITGEDMDMDDLTAIMDESIDEALDEIRGMDMQLEVTYYVAEDKVVSMTAYDPDSKTEISFDFFDGGNITGAIEGSGNTLEFASRVSDRDGYTHELTLSSGGETMTVAAAWDGSALSLDFDIPGEEPMSLTCRFKASQNSFEISGLTFEDAYETVEIPLTLKYASGGSVSMPRNTKNLLSMSEEEFSEFIAGMEELLGGMAENEDPYEDYGW